MTTTGAPICKACGVPILAGQDREWVDGKGSLHAWCVPGSVHRVPEQSSVWTYYPPVRSEVAEPLDLKLWGSWECHRCGAVNAPHVDRCSCGPNDKEPNDG